MSNSPLYLAIVLVWIIVLVPMLLRRDVADTVPRGTRRSPGHDARADDTDDLDDTDLADPHLDPEEFLADEELPEEDNQPADLPEPQDGTTTRPEPEPGPPPRPRSGTHRPQLTRARVIARRRRRTSGFTLLLLATIAAVAAGLGPWWVLVPPATLLFGHLMMLRTAAKLDTERHEARIRVERHRRAAEHRARAEAAVQAEREAEIIELAARRNQVYDQYADAYQRAAGD